jgi:hypothetical protein
MRKSTILFFTFILTACELTVDVDVPVKQEQLTVNSFFNPDSVWSASVKLNRNILDHAPIKSVEDATLIIYDESGPIDTLIHEGKGNYRSDAGKPQMGTKYEIRVEAENYQSVIGQSTIPLPVEITDFRLAFPTDKKDDILDIRINLKFKDDPNRKNYYHILLYTEGKYYYPSQGSAKKEIKIQSIENNLSSNYDENVLVNGGILLNDVLFNGKEATFSFKSYSSRYELEKNYESYKLSVRSVSEDYYRYLTTAGLQKSISGNPFAQPINIYNNIQKGFGVFAGFSQSTSTIILENPKRINITGIIPSFGRPGTEIIIAGKNFQSKGNTSVNVTFPGVFGSRNFAEVLEKSDTLLKIVVPPYATTGKIVVESLEDFDIADTNFEVIDSPPVISEFTPKKGKVGDEIIIKGENLKGHDATVIFYAPLLFPGRELPGRILENNDHLLRVIVPYAAETGKIAVRNNDKTTFSDEVFEVIK